MFNIDCEIAPLMDAIHQEAFKHMKLYLAQREEFFNKEINCFKKEQLQLEKKLEKLEQPPEPVKEKAPPKEKNKVGRKKTKKELEAEAAEKKRLAEEAEKLRLLKEEEERKRLEEEERKRKEEEEAAKKKGGAKDKKKKAEDEVPETPVEKTEEQKKEEEKQILREQIEVLKGHVLAYEAKAKLASDEKANQEAEEQRKKVTDLVEKASSDRKFLKAGSTERADTVLAMRRAYNFMEIKTPADDNAEEEVKLISVNGAAIRTPAEDIKWEEEQKELEANAPKGGKAPAKGKKK